jgi:hypothetical protein
MGLKTTTNHNIDVAVARQLLSAKRNTNENKSKISE